MTDARDIDCPKCANSGDDCGEHSPSWEELVDYWKNEAASLRKQLEDVRSEALEEAACIADSLAETYAEPTQRDYDRRDGAIEAATFIRKLKGKS